MSITQHTFDTPYPVGAVHCYSAELNGELTLFDTGPPTPEAREVLRQQLDLSRLRNVVCTHCHIDHYGQAAWLEKEFAATVYLPYRDALKIRKHEERLSAIGRLLLGLGFSSGFVASYRAIMEDGTAFPEFPRDFRIVEESELQERLGIEVLACPGHSQSDLVYATDQWAVTGDVLLEGIFQSPLLDVDLETGERFSNYKAYCRSLANLGRLRSLQICPGHRQRVASVDKVICFYVGKVLERAARLRPQLMDGNLAEIVFRQFAGMARNAFHLYLKASEVMFMQDFIADPGRLRRALEGISLFEPLEPIFIRAQS